MTSDRKQCSVEDITIWGELKGNITNSELNDIVCSYWSIAHCARHFSELDSASRNYLLQPPTAENVSTPLTPEQLKNLMTTAGSKLNPKLNNLIVVIKTLLGFLPEAILNRETHWVEFSSIPDSYYAELGLYLDKNKKAKLGLSANEPVGTLGAVFITPDIKPYIKLEQRGQGEESDQIKLNIITNLKPPVSDTITIGLKKDPLSQQVSLTSLYTSDGKFSPPFPNHRQSPEEFIYNTNWWANYAFFR